MSEPIPALEPPSFAGPVGVARKDITPPAGILAHNWGPATWRVATGVHRPLTLTALVVAEPSPFALLTLDLGWFEDRDDEWRVRKALIERLTLDPARVLLHLSHTHAGPTLTTARTHEPGGEFIGPYLDVLADAAVSATEEALAMARPSILSWRTGRCGLASNRDLFSGGRGLSGYNPAGRADDTLLVGRLTDETERTIATIVNYACHPTTLAWKNTLISPDYVGAMRELVEKSTGGAPCLFLQGASGELAPREQYVGDSALADRHGRELGYAVLGCLEGMVGPGNSLVMAGEVESGAPLAIWQQEPHEPSWASTAETVHVDLALKNLSYTPEPTGPSGDAPGGDLAGRLEGAGLQPHVDRLDSHIRAERLRRAELQLAQYGRGPTVGYTAWLWRLGDVTVVAHPGEAYSQLQTRLRERHPEQAVVVLNITNGCSPYLPAAEAYDHDTYPAWQTVFQRGCLEQVTEHVDAVIDRIDEETAASHARAVSGSRIRE